MSVRPLLLALLAIPLPAQQIQRLTHTGTPASFTGLVAVHAHVRERPVRPPRVPVAMAQATHRFASLLGEIGDGRATAEQVIALGRYAGALDSRARSEARALLAKLEIRLGANGRAGALPPSDRLRLAFLLADRFLRLGPDPDVGSLRDALRDRDAVTRLAALHVAADRPAVALALRPEVEAGFGTWNDSPLPHDAELTPHWSTIQFARRLAAARCLLLTAGDDARMCEAATILLDHGDVALRIESLRIAMVAGPGARPLLRRVVHLLHSKVDAEVVAALSALGAIGLPPRAQWPTRRTAVRTVTTSTDENARARARAELAFHGPWLDEALPRVARLAGEGRDSAARLARALLPLLERDAAGAAATERR